MTDAGRARLRSSADLEARLRDLDGAGYRAYRSLEGGYRLPGVELWIDRAQGDPFAEPSRVRLRVTADAAGFESRWIDDDDGRRAVGDFVLRRAAEAATDWRDRIDGSGSSGAILVDGPGQEILDRSGCRLTHEVAELRLRAGLPARGRRIDGRAAHRLLCAALPDVARRVLVCASLDRRRLEAHVAAVASQVALRAQLEAHGLVAFVADGACLPRRSGIDDRPADADGVVPWQSPDALAVELVLADGRRVRGCGVPRGLVLIVGGGFHGKSTLLRTIAHGVHDHVPGDGRELCVTRADAVPLRAEDGRAISAVDIGDWIGPGPGGRSTSPLTTTFASGSTSQAAALVEALECGSRLLLFDEDSSATNLLVRDAAMRRLVPDSQEPIRPLADRIDSLIERDISCVMVMGSGSAFFGAADCVIRLREYLPCDVTQEARALVDPFVGNRSPSTPVERRLDPASLDVRDRDRERSRARARQRLQLGREDVALDALELLVSSSQTRAIADALLWIHRRFDRPMTMAALLDAVESLWDEHGPDAAARALEPDRARPRRHELAAALNRVRSLRGTSRRLEAD